MYSLKKNKNLFFSIFFVILFFLNSCSDKEEANDYEKLGASVSDIALSGSSTIRGSVNTYYGKNALSGVTVSYKLSSTSGGFFATAETDDDGDYSQSSLTINRLHYLKFEKSGYISDWQFATLENENQTLTVSTVSMLPDNCSSTGDISGKITSALDKTVNLSGVTLTARSGINATSGTVVKTAETASNGTFTMSDMPRGWYTITASKSDYITEYLKAVSCGDIPDQDLAMSPTLSSGSMRIILTWPPNSTGDDLDSHLTGPDNASSRFHLYYTNAEGAFYYATNSFACSGCTSSQSSDNVSLDIDDKNGPPGTETITIQQVRDGTYRYSVFDFDNGQTNDNSSSTKLATSGAQVTVYYENSRTTYNVPNLAGTLWTVFTFTTSGGLVEVGTMGHQNASGNIE